MQNNTMLSAGSKDAKLSNSGCYHSWVCLEPSAGRMVTWDMTIPKPVESVEPTRDTWGPGVLLIYSVTACTTRLQSG